MKKYIGNIAFISFNPNSKIQTTVLGNVWLLECEIMIADLFRAKIRLDLNLKQELFITDLC